MKKYREWFVRKAILLFAVVIIFQSYYTPAIAATNGGTPVDSPMLSDFADNFFDEKMSEYHVPGAALVVVKDGEVVFSQGYGYADIEKAIPVDPDKSVFRVASVSKIFTIAGVMQLEEAGLIDISQDVNKYLKGFQAKNDFNEPILIKNLLTHTDGFETRDMNTFYLEPSDLPTLEDVLKNDLARVHFRRVFGSKNYADIVAVSIHVERLVFNCFCQTLDIRQNRNVRQSIQFHCNALIYRGGVLVEFLELIGV